MRIGKVAETYNMSINNLYYYIKAGLLVPPYKGEQYDFDEACLDDLDLILSLKKMEFSIKEIHTILSLRRISNDNEPELINDIYELADKKIGELENRRQKLNTSIQLLSDYQQKLTASTVKQSSDKTQKGMPFAFLNHLTCPKCKKDLVFSNMLVQSNQVFECQMFCNCCGYKAMIEKGILKTENRYNGLYDRPDLKRELYKDIPAQLISLYQHAYHWMLNAINGFDSPGKIILETHINMYCFTYTHLHKLPQNCYYIITDKFPEMLALYKSLFEEYRPELNILYIANDGTDLPLREAIVDYGIDFFSSNEHNFFDRSNLITELSHYYKLGAKIIGTYFHLTYGPNTMSNLMRCYPNANRQNFNLKQFEKSCQDAGFQITASKTIGSIAQTGQNWCFDYHQDGEELFMTSFIAEKQKENRL